MRETPYKVRFTYRPVQLQEQGKGRGWIDGYRTARLAKEEVARVNERTDKHGLSAVYLGRK
jgi:hypothetical protein